MEVFMDGKFRLELTKIGGMSAKHGCYEEGERLVAWVFVYPGTAAYCWRCQQRIPEGLIALYKMYQWGKE